MIQKIYLIGAFLSTLSFMDAATAKPYVGVSSGKGYTCLLKPTEAACWGYDHGGNLDSIKGLVNARRIVSGHSFNCVLDDRGVTCWGTGHGTEVPEGLG